MGTNNKTDEPLFGGLTRKQIGEMEIESRRMFIGTLDGEERHEYFVGAFLSNLNQNAKKENDTKENQPPSNA